MIDVPTSQPTTAVVKLSTSGALAPGNLIGGIDVTLSLPAGVSVKAVTIPPQTDIGVVTASGVAAGALASAVYWAATGTLPAEVRVLLINAYGFSTGEFVTINCDIAAGATPNAAGFLPTHFSASNLNGADISGLTLGLATDIR